VAEGSGGGEMWWWRECVKVEGGGAGACRRVGGEGGKVGREERWGGRKGHGGGVGWKGEAMCVCALSFSGSL
jgi:hypothetical protein